jgi:hypothetical protein
MLLLGGMQQQQLLLLVLLVLLPQVPGVFPTVLDSCQAGVCCIGDVPFAFKVLLQRLHGVARHLTQPTHVLLLLLTQLLLLQHTGHTHTRIPRGRRRRLQQLVQLL